MYVGMRGTAGRNAPQVRAAADYAKERVVDLRAVELDVNSEDSVDAAVEQTSIVVPGSCTRPAP